MYDLAVGSLHSLIWHSSAPSFIMRRTLHDRGHAVVEAVLYKTEGRGFDSR